MTLRMPALGRTITLAAAAALTGGFLAVTPASALDDGDQSFFETMKGLAGYAIGFGMGSGDEDEQPRINYRERAPLVLPPNKGNQLPVPGQGAGARNPNWPTDYDEGRRQRANAAKNRNRETDSMGTNRMSNEELARGRTRGAAARNPSDEQCGVGGTDAYGNICDQARYWSVMKNTRKADDNRDLQGGVEPGRKALTDPPTGLRRATNTVKATAEAPREEVPLLDAAGQAREEARIRRERYENQ